MRDYLALLLRRKYHILIPFALILGGGITLAYTLPPVYQSIATILIKDAEIPTEFIKTTVTGYVQQRIEEIRQETLTRAKLIELADEIGYYKSQELAVPPTDSEIATEMKENIIVEMVDVRANEAGSRGGAVTVAFTVAFEAPQPQIAKLGAKSVTERFIEANRGKRLGAAEGVIVFLQKQVTSAESKITDLEAQLTAFKEKHVNELPEQVASNRQLLEQTEGKLERTEEKIREIEDEITSVSGQLSYINPYKEVKSDDGRVVQTSYERLNVLTAEYKAASARYSPDHPEVRSIRRELQAIAAELGASTDAGQLLNELIRVREELARAEQRYSAAHPDVRKLSSRVSTLERDLSEAAVRSNANPTTAPTAAARPDNPVYVNLVSRLNSLRANLRSRQSQLASYQAKISEYEERVYGSPGVEQEYNSLTNKLAAAKATYEDLENKLTQATHARSLEEGGKGERFEVVEPAFFPNEPDRPNRLGIALLSFLLAISAGIGAAAIGEFTDKTIYGSKGLAAAFGAKPIAVIPKIPEHGGAGATASGRVAQGLATAIVIVVIASAVLFVYQLNKPEGWRRSGRLCQCFVDTVVVFTRNPDSFRGVRWTGYPKL